MIRRMLAAGFALLAAAGIAIGAAALRPPGPSEAEGAAWFKQFADLITSDRLLGAHGPGIATLFPGLTPDLPADCDAEWRLDDRWAPIVTEQRLELGRFPDAPCDTVQFGILRTTLRQSANVTPGAFVQRLTEEFGPPEVTRETGLTGSIVYRWLVLDGMYIRIEEAAGPGAHPVFSVDVTKFLGSPDRVATPEEGERWMTATVALLTNPALAAARGPAAVAMIPAPLQPMGLTDEECPSIYRTDVRIKGPIASEEALYLDHTEGRPCAQAPFSQYSVSIWQRAPVTAEALVARFSATLGAPAVTREFDRQGIEYTWKTHFHTVIGLFEGFGGDWSRYMRLRTSLQTG